MKITIKHNIKREGCTLSGQILDYQFCGGPQISDNMVFVWGEKKENDFDTISYTYPTEQAAQDMLDFINTFVEKDEAVKEETKEKRYMIVEVGGEECKFRSRNVLIQSVKYFCRIDYEDCDIEHCKNCPHGKTLEQIQEEVKKLQEAQ